MAWRSESKGIGGRISLTEQWVLGSGNHISDTYIEDNELVDSILQDLADITMTSPGLQSSLTQYEQLVKKQLSFNEDDSEGGSNATPNSNGTNEDGGVFDKPLTEERQQGMRAVQNTLERLDSKHGVLERPASAECVRDAVDDTEMLKRTMSDSIQRPSVTATNTTSEPEEMTDTNSGVSRSRQGSTRSESSEPRSIPPTRIPQPATAKPQLKTPLTTNRTVPITSSPKTQEGNKPLKVKATDKDVEQSPDKTLSMRQLLVESKAETSELQRQIELLTNENQRLKSSTNLSNGHSSSTDTPPVAVRLVEAERRCDTLIREKENMATELWKLRQQVEELLTSKSEFGSEVGDGTSAQPATVQERQARPADANSRAAEREIDDLHTQIVELQEANETSNAEVLRLDQENQMLTAHIKRLNADRDEDEEAERELLQQQLSELRKQQEQQSDDEVLHLRSEMARLRIDLKAMQEKADILQEENVKLRESLREAKSSNRWKGSGSSVQDNPDQQEARKSKEVAWEEISALKQKIREFSTRTSLAPTAGRTVDRRSPQMNPISPKISLTGSYDRPSYKPSYSNKESSFGQSAYSPTNRRRDTYRQSYQPSNQSSDDRPPSPSGRSDISESTTVLMAGFDAYKPLSRSGNSSRVTPTRKVEDDRISECTMDILNEATFNTQAFGAYDVNDEVRTGERGTRKESTGYTGSHLRRGSVGSSSIQSESTQDLLSERLPAPPSFGLRSVLAPVLPTQHNRPDYAPPRSLLSTAGRRPFAPRSPADLAIGDIAKFTKPDGRICRGVVKFIGHLHDKNETYIGLELEFQDGKHDGTYEGIRYFDSKPNRGAFITFNKVIMVWGS